MNYKISKDDEQNNTNYNSSAYLINTTLTNNITN